MYYETITRSADATFTHKKIMGGGGGEFAVVSLRLEPLPGSGLLFINNVTDEVLPAKLVACVKGFRRRQREVSWRGIPSPICE